MGQAIYFQMSGWDLPFVYDISFTFLNSCIGKIDLDTFYYFSLYSYASHEKVGWSMLYFMTGRWLNCVFEIWVVGQKNASLQSLLSHLFAQGQHNDVISKLSTSSLGLLFFPYFVTKLYLFLGFQKNAVSKTLTSEFSFYTLEPNLDPSGYKHFGFVFNNFQEFSAYIIVVSSFMAMFHVPMSLLLPYYINSKLFVFFLVVYHQNLIFVPFSCFFYFVHVCTNRCFLASLVFL